MPQESVYSDLLVVASLTHTTATQRLRRPVAEDHATSSRPAWQASSKLASLPRQPLQYTWDPSPLLTITVQ